MMRFFMGVLLALLSHQINFLFRLWEEHNGRGWVLLGRYSFGGLLIVFTQWLLSDRDDRDEIAQSGVVALVSVGVGVAGGYVIDEMVAIKNSGETEVHILSLINKLKTKCEVYIIRPITGGYFS